MPYPEAQGVIKKLWEQSSRFLSDELQSVFILSHVQEPFLPSEYLHIIVLLFTSIFIDKLIVYHRTLL